MSAARPRLDIDATRERLVALGLLHAGEILDEVLADAVREETPAHTFLDKLLGVELERREERRIRTSLRLSNLPTGQTLDNFDYAFQPAIERSRIETLATGAWVRNAEAVFFLGPTGTGKSHLAAAIGFALVENGYRVLFARTTDLVQKLQRARQELALEAALNRLDRFHLLILDDFTYLHKNEAESGVLFELISLRYERRSLLITANQPFQEWARLFPSETVAVAAVDRLVHHSIILEMNAESYRRRAAQRQDTKPGRPAQYATRKNTATDENK